MRYNKKTDMTVGKRFNHFLVLEETNLRDWGAVLYKCKCDCGNIVLERGTKLRRGDVKMCLNCYNNIRNRDFVKRILYVYKYSAKRRKLDFTLDNNQFENLITSNCYYCDSEPNNIKKIGKTDKYFLYNGIDRLNNNLGYTIENCVSCCAWCNRSKNTHTTKEFYSWITQIYNKMNNIKVKACQ